MALSNGHDTPETLADQQDRMANRLSLFKKIEKWFFWVKWFYPKARGVPLAFQLYCLIPQKLFRINSSVPWPVHFTSRVLYPDRIQLGNNCAPGISGSCYIQARNGIIIGHNFRMGPGVGLISANHDLDDYDLHPRTPPIVIGDNVWIGMNSVVMPGITIGDNVVIGANSVVTRDVPSNVVAGGNPCKVIRPKGPYKGRDYSRL